MTPGPLLTLEPLVEAVRSGVEGAGWSLSGLQKTTSHAFEGRWEGESTRSAYLFFHRPDLHENVSVDVYLDETSRGLQGNLALVVDARAPGTVAEPVAALDAMRAAAEARLPRGYTTPLTLRFRLPDTRATAEEARGEWRIKLRIPGAAIETGAGAVESLAAATVAAFEALLEEQALVRWAVLE